MSHPATPALAGLSAAPPDNALASLARGVDRGLGAIVETAAAALVLAEIIVLFAGVVARYVFHQPLVWSDELASLMFLWLSMLGAVVALRRGEHMRMTAFINNVQPGLRAALEAFALAASLAFLLMVLGPAYEYAEEEAFITTPAMELSNAWRAAALPAGMGLMAVVALLRLLTQSSWQKALAAVAMVAGLDRKSVV